MLNMDFDVLANFNPWWQSKAVPQEFVEKRKRPAFAALEKNLQNRFIILLYGLRRVGKTTTLYQMIAHLLKNGTPAQNILYFSFDEKKALIREVVSSFEENALQKKIADSGRVFAFFDEIQKEEDWESKIKILYDLNPNIKIFLSGSAAITLRKKSAESLAGRMLDFQLTPLSFAEFLEWNGKPAGNFTAGAQIMHREMTLLLADYLRKGGFPEITFEQDAQTIKNYLKNAVLEKIIYRDIPEEFKVRDVELLKNLLELFIMEPGMIASIERLSKDLSRNKVTVTNYIEYLKSSLLIREVRNLRPNMLLSSRKGKKIYPASTGLCFGLMQDFHSDSKMEKIFETAVAARIEAQYYYRNSFEVDFVIKDGSKKPKPIEVKHGKDEEWQLRAFMHKFGAEKAILVTKDRTWEKDGITATPLWQFLLREEI